jgi:hypothetical protein
LVVANDKDVLDFQDVHGVLQDGQEGHVGVDDQVGDVTGDED